MATPTEGPDDLASSTPGDVINGLGGNDTMSATAAGITLDGGSGDDQLFSSGGSTLIGGKGDDLLISTGVNDTASYAGAKDGATVDLSASTASDGDGGSDTLIGIANVTGSAYGDSLTGDDGANVFQGGAGDDTLTGNGGADVFKYSFNLAQGAGGETFRFTDWLSAKFGKDFGDELPDYVKNNGHHSRYGDHHRDGHGGRDDDGHCGGDGQQAANAGLTENFFEKNYGEWIKEVVVADLLEQDYVLDANGNGRIKIDINEDGRNGTPRIEGLTKDQLAEMFGERDSVILNDGGRAEKAWYSNSYTSQSRGEDTVASGDGHDTILDFDLGVDKLDFSGITVEQFSEFFNVADGTEGTVITIDGFADWSVTLTGVHGFDVSSDMMFS